MLKITPLVIGFLTVMSIAPKSQAMTANTNSLTKPAGELHAQVFVRVGERPEHRHHRRAEHRRHERFEHRGERQEHRRHERFEHRGERQEHRSERHERRHDHHR